MSLQNSTTKVDLAERKLRQIKAMADVFSHWGEDLPEGEKFAQIQPETLVSFCGAIEDLAVEAEEALSEVYTQKPGWGGPAPAKS
jgi:hypothetical protein